MYFILFYTDSGVSKSMTLEDLEQLDPEKTGTDTLEAHVNTLVAENEYVKTQITALLDRQDRVAAVWGRFIEVILKRIEQQKTNNSI